MRALLLTVAVLATVLPSGASAQTPADETGARVSSRGATAHAGSAGPADTVGPPRFWVTDTHRYTSPWFAGAHRKMVGYGCTRAPYYDPSPQCAHGRGFHHGLDLAMPCGTELFAGFPGWVVAPASPGALGAAYGPDAFRIRNHHRGVDVVIGHVKKVYVAPGDRVRKGRLIARANKLGAPDGCHLHFEVRPIGGGYLSAVRPHPSLMLRR
jgi:murein DD-endopeptidase MepM/ murein hydrolase activator NlpD